MANQGYFPCISCGAHPCEGLLLPCKYARIGALPATNDSEFEIDFNHAQVRAMTAKRLTLRRQLTPRKPVDEGVDMRRPGEALHEYVTRITKGEFTLVPTHTWETYQRTYYRVADMEREVRALRAQAEGLRSFDTNFDLDVATMLSSTPDSVLELLARHSGRCFGGVANGRSVPLTRDYVRFADTRMDFQTISSVSPTEPTSVVSREVEYARDRYRILGQNVSFFFESGRSQAEKAQLLFEFAETLR